MSTDSSETRSGSRWISELHWQRTGQQTRSERTQTALLDAAEKLILEKGTDATSIAEIAKHAGCSVGTVYHHFKDKKALFFALFHRMTDAYENISKQASNPSLWEGASVLDLFRGYLELTLQAGKEKSAVKAAVLAVVADHPDLAKHYAEIQGKSRKLLMDLVLSRRDEIGHQDVEHAVAFVVDQVAAMIRNRMDQSQKPARLTSINDDLFIEGTLEMVSGYLRLSK